mmetsp:Transcript_12893/g.31360  ORF Transcript_12893/g.31360 Transcript_12893/m.31360 type:complete len:270 (-) Transcript_12893:245-1054(-)
MLGGSGPRLSSSQGGGVRGSQVDSRVDSQVDSRSESHLVSRNEDVLHVVVERRDEHADLVPLVRPEEVLALRLVPEGEVLKELLEALPRRLPTRPDVVRFEEEVVRVLAPLPIEHVEDVAGRAEAVPVEQPQHLEHLPQLEFRELEVRRLLFASDIGTPEDHRDELFGHHRPPEVQRARIPDVQTLVLQPQPGPEVFAAGGTHIHSRARLRHLPDLSVRRKHLRVQQRCLLRRDRGWLRFSVGILFVAGGFVVGLVVDRRRRRRGRFLC